MTNDGRVARRRQRRQRRERIGGVVLLVLGIVVAMVAVGALMNRHATGKTADKTVIITQNPASSSSKPSATKSSTQSSSTEPSTPASTATSSSSASLPVVVRNNTTISGLAERAASELRAQGYTVSSVGNYSNNILSTCAYYDPSVAGAEAEANQLNSQFSWIVRVKPKFDGLPSGPIVVVLASNIS